MHDYHFLITEEILFTLNKISELKNLSFSGKFNFILKYAKNISDLLSHLNIDEESKMEYLETKKDVHLFMKEQDYRTIKEYHSRYNIFSMAFYIRLILSVFVKMVKKYGYSMTLKKLKKVKQKLKRINRIKSIKYKIIQLLNYLRIKVNKNLKLSDIFNILLL